MEPVYPTVFQFEQSLDFDVDTWTTTVPDLDNVNNPWVLESLEQPAARQTPYLSTVTINPEVNDGSLRTNIPIIDPNVPKRISRSQWEQYRKIVEDEYQSKTLKELRIFMSAHHGFIASEQQWKKKLSDWRLGKNLPPRVTRFIKKRATSRRVQESKSTQFRLGGQEVPMDKIKRHLQSSQHYAVSSTGSTPDGLSYCTIKSPVLVPPGLALYNSSAEERSREEKITMPKAATSRAILTSINENVPDVDPLRMAVWQGCDADYFVNASRTAMSHAKHGDYLSAKPAFMESLDGLEVLLGLNHAQTITVEEQFVRAAVEYQDFDGGIERLQKSYNTNLATLGKNDKNTCRSLARLGNLYKQTGQLVHAYHMLSNAREGLLACATELSPEHAYNSTKDIVETIADVLTDQGDYETAEKELLSLISQADELGELYQSDAAIFKHNLVHLYNNAGWRESAETLGMPGPPRRSVEKLLLDITRSKRIPYNREGIVICCWEQLRVFYESTRQDEKLEGALPLMEKFLDRMILLEPYSFSKMFELKQGIATSYMNLRQYDKAEWWLLHVQLSIEETNHPGPLSHEALSNLMYLAKLYLGQRKSNSAKEYLKKAQEIAKQALPLSHTFHAYVEYALKYDKLDAGSCGDCLVNKADKRPSLSTTGLNECDSSSTGSMETSSSEDEGNETCGEMAE